MYTVLVSITLPASVLRRALWITLGLMAVASAVTQLVAVVSGRDFLFGVIPAFAPAGQRNLITWLSSMLLIVAAALAALEAGIRALDGDTSARGWRTLALVLAVFSLAWMTGLAGLVTFGVVPPAFMATALVVGGAAVASLALVATRQSVSPPVPIAVWLGVLLLVASRPAPVTALVPPGAVAALLAWLCRVIEWAGIACLLLVSLRRLSARAPRFLLRVVATAAWPAQTRQGDQGIELLVCPAVVKRWSTAAIVGLTTASLLSAGAVRAWPARAESWYRFLYVDFEGNLPTWASSLLLFACAAVTATLATADRARGVGTWWYWALMAAGFTALSADEAASLHELLVSPLREMVGGATWLRYPLILPGLPAVLVAAVLFGRFLGTLPGETRRALTGGGALFLSGALVIETMGGWFDPVLHGENLPYVVLAALEEACEMAGALMALTGLLGHIGRHVGALDLHVVDDGRASAAVAPPRHSAIA